MRRKQQEQQQQQQQKLEQENLRSLDNSNQQQNRLAQNLGEIEGGPDLALTTAIQSIESTNIPRPDKKEAILDTTEQTLDTTLRNG